MTLQAPRKSLNCRFDLNKVRLQNDVYYNSQGTNHTSPRNTLLETGCELSLCSTAHTHTHTPHRAMVKHHIHYNINYINPPVTVFKWAEHTGGFIIYITNLVMDQTKLCVSKIFSTSCSTSVCLVFSADVCKLYGDFIWSKSQRCKCQ